MEVFVFMIFLNDEYHIKKKFSFTHSEQGVLSGLTELPETIKIEAHLKMICLNKSNTSCIIMW